MNGRTGADELVTPTCPAPVLSSGSAISGYTATARGGMTTDVLKSSRPGSLKMVARDQTAVGDQGSSVPFPRSRGGICPRKGGCVRVLSPRRTAHTASSIGEELCNMVVVIDDLRVICIPTGEWLRRSGLRRRT